MTRRVTISVPDDVADHLDGIPSRQVSAYVTEALRRRQASDDLRLALHTAGHRDYPHDILRRNPRRSAMSLSVSMPLLLKPSTTPMMPLP